MTLRSLIAIGAFSAALGGCFGSSPEVARQPAEPRIVSEADINHQLGRRVRVIGQATNTRHGASVVDSGLSVYLDEYRAFPGNVVGKRVEAAGIIARDAGGVVRVVDGKPMVFLRDASYLLLDNAAPKAEALELGKAQ
jgi:hypothetical protein